MFDERFKYGNSNESVILLLQEKVLKDGGIVSKETVCCVGGKAKC